MKQMKWLAAGIALVVLSVATGAVMADNPKSGELNPSVLNRAVIRIDSLSCGGCFSTISAGLAPLEGFSGMGANLFRKLIAIDFSAPLTPEKISEKLSEIGYPGAIEAVDTIVEKESFAYLESRRTGFASNGGSCCSGGYPGGAPAARDGAGLLPQAGGSCCDLPAVSSPPESL